MKVLVAGASGAIGAPLTRLLISRGYEVLALIRNPAGEAALRRLGATPVVADALDRDGLLRALNGLRADAVIHELTALKKPPMRTSGLALTNRLRTAGTSNLVVAAEQLGATRFITQSIIFGYGYRDHGTAVLSEDAAFGERAGTATDDAVAAMRSAEEQTFATQGGIALRYGVFYGGDGPQMNAALRSRNLPIFGGGRLGWVHHFDAATATANALEVGRPGEAYNIVDDQPATWQEVFSAMAQHFNAPSPRHLPRWVMRLFAPNLVAFAIDTNMLVSNAKAKRELGWQPRFRSYREGIAAMTPQGAVRAIPLANALRAPH